MRRRAGFTLIELLVVVAIIALLIAILLPSIGKARTQARSARCLAGERSISISLQTYMRDWDTALPYAKPQGSFSDSYWVVLLRPYGNIDKVQQCPEATNLNIVPDSVGTAHSPWYVTGKNFDTASGCYSFNGWLYKTTGADASAMLNTPFVSTPIPTVAEFWTWPFSKYDSVIPMVGDGASPNIYPHPDDTVPMTVAQEESVAAYTPPEDLKTTRDQMHRFAMTRHGKGINVTFLDGHSDTIRLGSLWTFKWSTSDWSGARIVP